MANSKTKHKSQSDSRTINAEVSDKSLKENPIVRTKPKPLTEEQSARVGDLVAPEDGNSSPNAQLTAKNAFYPSKKQRLFLDSALKADKHEITAIAKHAGIGRGAWYEWIKDDNFVKWYNDMWQKALDASAWKLDAMGLAKASDDHKYWKSMQQRSGRLLEGNQQNTQINIGGLSVDFIED